MAFTYSQAEQDAFNAAHPGQGTDAGLGTLSPEDQQMAAAIGMNPYDVQSWVTYGPHSGAWAMYGGSAPINGGWSDYLRRTSEGGAAEAARQSNGDGFGLGDFLMSVAPLAILGVGGMGLAGMLGEGAASAGLAGAGAAEAGGLSWLGNSGLATIPEAVAGMGAGTTAAAGGGLSWLGNEGLASIPEAVGSTQGGMFGAFNPGAVMDAAGSAAAYNPGAVLDAATAAAASGGGGAASLIPGFTNAQLVSGGLSLVGGLLSGNAAQGAAKTSADAQLEAARIAADAAKFRPVGVTTRFGQSQFQKDAQGNVIGAGYNLSPDVKAQQDQLMAASGGMLNQFTGSQATTAPMGQAAQSMFNLGQGYLTTDPQAQAAKYLADQKALLATGRERDLANLESRLMSQGRLGLATGGTSTGMMAANPEMEALRNAQLQQDLGLAAAATQGGMDYAKFGAGMVGSGGQMLRDMYGTQQAAYAPYQTALQGSQYLEGLGQNALTLGMDIGKTTSAASGNAGGLLAQGMTNAANTMQPSNAYSPWGAMLTGAGNTVANMSAQQNPTYDPSKFRLVPFGT